MGDLIRNVHETPGCELVGIYHPDVAPMADCIASYNIHPECVHTDMVAALSQSGADVAIVCSTTATHASVAAAAFAANLHVIIEKPFATNVQEAQQIIDAATMANKLLAVNWPLAWYPSHVTAQRIIAAGTIGDPVEVHYYGGNRGPLHHGADKLETSLASQQERKLTAWWYDPALGGGSLRDYLGYGTTLGTWFLNGQEPITVTAVTDQPAANVVDEHAIVVCRYAAGLSKFETRWGTFTDPWTIQPQPKCGFVIVGTRGTVSSYDYDDFITLQTEDNPQPYAYPVELLTSPYTNVIEHMHAVLQRGIPLHKPLTPEIGRIGQRITDAAIESIIEGRTVTY